MWVQMLQVSLWMRKMLFRHWRFDDRKRYLLENRKIVVVVVVGGGGLVVSVPG
jgi:hypothetical protein